MFPMMISGVSIGIIVNIIMPHIIIKLSLIMMYIFFEIDLVKRFIKLYRVENYLKLAKSDSGASNGSNNGSDGSIECGGEK